MLLLWRHFPTAAEIHLLAVRRDWHRRGVGTALVTSAERMAGADGANLLSVKTLGPSHPDPNYRRTRAFYHALGFLPVQELHGLWPDNPCLIMVKPLVGQPEPNGVLGSGSTPSVILPNPKG